MTTETRNILVTGANSGLGLGICLRLTDDFLRDIPTPQRLNIIFTTRTKTKASQTLRTLEAHLAKSRVSNARDRVSFQAETNVELTNLLSVRNFARRLNASDLTQLNGIICNAGIGGWSGLDWPHAVRSVLADIRNATTWPQFKLGVIGSITKPQFPDAGKNAVGDSGVAESPLGEVFCANLFGHYMLAHWLMPLLRACEPDSPGKIIWISSIEPQAYHLSPDDLQGLKSDVAYEHSKRVTDLLNLTSTHPAASPYVTSFLSAPKTLSSPLKKPNVTVRPPSKSRARRPDHGPPNMHEMQPGIVVTSVISLYWIVHQAYMAGIYLARLLGAPWSTVQPYSAALAATWLALASDEAVRARQEQAVQPPTSTSSKSATNGTGKVKWGTAVSRFGTPAVQATDVEGWGINGSGQPFAETWWGGRYATGGTYGRGRNPQRSIDATSNDVEKFVEQGVRAWREMEALRQEWDARIEEYEAEMAGQNHTR